MIQAIDPLAGMAFKDEAHMFHLNHDSSFQPRVYSGFPGCKLVHYCFKTFKPSFLYQFIFLQADGRKHGQLDPLDPLLHSARHPARLQHLQRQQQREQEEREQPKQQQQQQCANI